MTGEPAPPPRPGRRALHPWLRPLHRRVTVCAALLLWLGFEAWYEPLSVWFFVVAAITIYALWDFFIAGRLRETERDGTRNP